MTVEQVGDTKVVRAAGNPPLVAGCPVERLGFGEQVDGLRGFATIEENQREVAQPGCRAGDVAQLAAQGETLDEVPLRARKITGSPGDDAEAVEALGLTFPVAVALVGGERQFEPAARHRRHGVFRAGSRGAEVR